MLSQQANMNKYFRLLLSIIICELVGLIGTPFTISAIQSWYVYLNKPFFSPPNWIFGPVWTTLYALMGISAYLIWSKGFKNKKVKKGLQFFGIQLGFNFIWSILFFGLHNPILGFLDIILLWISIFITIKKFYVISKPAAYLLIPYLAWVSFASLLNLSIILLNR